MQARRDACSYDIIFAPSLRYLSNLSCVCLGWPGADLGVENSAQLELEEEKLRLQEEEEEKEEEGSIFC